MIRLRATGNNVSRFRIVSLIVLTAIRDNIVYGIVGTRAINALLFL